MHPRKTGSRVFVDANYRDAVVDRELDHGGFTAIEELAQ